MNPIIVIAIPLVLFIVGMILNGIGLGSHEPANSQEQNPTKRLEAERDAYRKSFQSQRSQTFRRQKWVGQYAWLLLIAFFASHLWMYFDTVNRSKAWNQIAALQTMSTDEGKAMALSVTLSDGSNVKYLIKMTKADALDTATTQALSQQKVSSWELSDTKTALSIGDNPLPLGVALTITN